MTNVPCSRVALTASAVQKATRTLASLCMLLSVRVNQGGPVPYVIMTLTSAPQHLVTHPCRQSAMPTDTLPPANSALIISTVIRALVRQAGKGTTAIVTLMSAWLTLAPTKFRALILIMGCSLVNVCLAGTALSATTILTNALLSPA
jgi:hypothetical protein